MPSVIIDPGICHYCNKNRLDKFQKFYLPNGIEVCEQCYARIGKQKKRA